MLKEKLQLDDYLNAIAEMSEPIKQNIVINPKPWIIKELTSRLPQEFNKYYEPFIGGGALLFEIMPKKAFISDLNQELITTYLVVKNNPKELIKILDYHRSQHAEEYFYKVRENESFNSALEIAGRFIYLNKSCFNGLYRVNSKGRFNSPLKYRYKSTIFWKNKTR